MTAPKDLLKRALDAIDLLSGKLAASEARAREPVAIVGMGCRLPGSVATPAEYWALLREGRSGIVEVPADRWDVDAFYDADPKAVGKMYTRHGGFLDRIDEFDAAFFGIAPREASALDPQHRLLLECAWEALEDAGESPDRLVNSATGVYVGITTSDYARLSRGATAESDVYSASGTALNAAAGRLSFALGLQGPCMAIDTACSSSLTAAHVAVQSLRARECNLALVGGVNVMASPDASVLFSRWGMIAPGAECRTFDAGANGFVRGEGCGVLVLKRLSDAQADGNRILAVIRGSAVNQDGPSSGLSVPNGLAQAKVMRAALDNAGLQPRDVQYVEAHGTGTVLGDPIEVEALGDVYGADRDEGDPLLLGSVKPAIGHLESAAGVAGIMKLVLAVQHGELAPQRNFREPNPRIAWSRLPIRVVETLTTWPAPVRGAHAPPPAPRIGGVSGFGFSGTNVHMIIESPPTAIASAAPSSPAPRQAHVIPLSARTPAALRDAAARLAMALAAPEAPCVADVARTLSLGRAHLAHRAIVVGSDLDTLRRRLAKVADDDLSAGTRRASTDRTVPKVAFLFTGQGAQYHGMGLELRETFPVFRDAFDHCDALLRDRHGLALRETLAHPHDTTRVHETAVTQPALFAVEYALTALLRSWGVAPAAVMGHSVGEYVAACVAGVLSLDDALGLVAERGRLMQALPTGGGMLAVNASAEIAMRAAADHLERVALAAINGPADVVLSGDIPSLRVIARTLKAEGVECKALRVSHAFHSPLMDPMLDALTVAAARVSSHTPAVPLVSNLSGRPDALPGSSAEYWRRHAREPVAFEASMRHLADDGIRVFLEVGPRPVLLGMARKFLHAETLSWIPTLRGSGSEVDGVLEAIGSLFTVGVPPDWERVLDGAGQRVALPTYPFQRKRFWLSAATETSASAGTATPATAPADDDLRHHPFLGARVASPLRERQYQCVLDPVRRPILREHAIAGAIVVPAAALIEMAIAAGTELFGTPTVRLEAGHLKQALALDDRQPRDLQLVVTPRDDTAADVDVFSRARGSDDAWVSHASARVVRPGASIATDTPPDLSDALAVDIDAYQARMREAGLEYGPAFRALVAARRKPGEAIGDVRLPTTDVLTSRLSIHPGLLDAAFHLIGLALPESDDTRESDHFYLPVGYDVVEMMAPAGHEATAHVRIRTHDAHRVVADVTVWRMDGSVALRVGGLHARQVSRRQFRAATRADQHTALLRTIWRPVDATAMPTHDALQGAEWMLLGGTDAFADDIAALLRAVGATVHVASGEEAHDVAAQLQQGAWHDLRGVIDLRALSLPSLTTDAVAIACDLEHSPFFDVLALLRAIAAGPPRPSLRVVLPTRLAHAVLATDRVEPSATMVWGVAASAAAELPWLDLRMLDVDTDDGAAGALVTTAIRTDGERMLAVRGNALHAARLVPVSTPLGESLSIPETPYALTMQTRGVLDGLGIEGLRRREPGPTQVEIEVVASGLNFRDVLNLLDMYPGPAGPLGNECAGRIVALGRDVTGFAIGELVTCIAESTFASHVVAEATMTFRVPAQLSAAQAAAFPIVQLTAFLALHRVGQLRAGDRVLIHAGAGGVGLAAVHLALAAGADVLASAGSEAKRAYLSALGVRVVFDSRQPALAEEIRAATDGHGVDLLLNSLTGEFIREGLRALAPGGRFLEIGLRDVWTDNAVRAVRSDVHYHALLLGDVCRDDPAAIRTMYETLCAMLADGRLPAPAVRTFPVADSTAAFRFMAKARHIGRIAIVHPARGCSLVRADASYLVTGGLGALGLQVADWLSAQGAGHLVLMGRREGDAHAAETLQHLRARGTVVEVRQGDVANPDDLAFLSEPLRPPVRGVIHAAGITDDAALSRVDVARLSGVVRPKADGALNLARATRTSSLDFEVFFSSGSAVLGAPGQAAYAGANSFLDGLAHRRRAEGHRTLSVNWGAWSGGGMVARVGDRTREEWSRRGIGVLGTVDALALLEDGIRRELAQVVALPIDWPRFIASLPDGRVPSLLLDLLRELGQERVPEPGRESPRARGSQRASGYTTDAVPPVPARRGTPADNRSVDGRDALRSLPAREQLAALTTRLRAEAAAVLGADDPEDLDVQAGLMEQGMDSLMTVELSSRLSRLFGVSLPSTFAFDHPTLVALARHLLEQLQPQLQPAQPRRQTPVASGNAVTDPAAEMEAELDAELDAGPEADLEIDALTDDEIEAALREELNRAGF